MKQRIIDAYDKITPIRSDDEIVHVITGKAGNMEKKKIRFRKPLVAVCAAVTALGLGVTAAGAAGIIDFRSMFGGRIIAHDESVDSALLADISNVKVYSENEQYTLELGGVISTGSIIAGSCELIRTDGAPVAEYMYDIDTSKRFDSGDWWNTLYDENGEMIQFTEHGGIEMYLGFVMNENGNINCNFHFNASDIIENAERAEITFSADWIKTEDNRPFMMSVGFDLAPSNEAIVRKTIADNSEPITLSDRTEAKVIHGSFDCLSGCFTLEYEAGSDGLDFDDGVTLILNDGEEIHIHLWNMTYISNNNGNTEETFHFVYSDELDGNITAVNADEITAVSIKGTIFELA